MKKRDKSLVEEKYRETFFTVLRAIFASRRKTIRNNLQSSIYGNEGKDKIEMVIEKAQLKGDERAESLETEQIVNLAMVIQDNIMC